MISLKTIWMQIFLFVETGRERTSISEVFKSKTQTTLEAIETLDSKELKINGFYNFEQETRRAKWVEWATGWLAILVSHTGRY